MKSKTPKTKRRFSQMLCVMSIISLTYILLFSGFYIHYYDMDYYNNQFKDNGAAEKLGEENASFILKDLLTYLNIEEAEERVDHLSYFSEKEKSHLADVKLLLTVIFSIYYLAVILLVFSLIWFFTREKKWKREWAKMLLWAGSLTTGIIIILLLGALLNFDFTFQLFHKIFFPQGNFAFPADSLLKTLFPDSFFTNFALKIITTTLSVSVLAAVVGFAWKKQLRIKN